MTLTACRLREVLEYDPATGVFRWRVGGHGRKVGRTAGLRETDSEQYVRIRIDGQSHLAHRLAFLYMTGSWPRFMVDHMDGDGRNNQWTNLRDVNNQVNQQNRRRASSKSKTGVLGVSPTKEGKFAVYIKDNGKNKNMGSFPTIEAAIEARVAAERTYYPSKPA